MAVGLNDRDHAAELVSTSKALRFGFITTNSIGQSFSRKVIEHHLSKNEKFGLRYCIPDHPWVDSSDGASVRIAMTVADTSQRIGMFARVIREHRVEDDEVEVELQTEAAKISGDLRIGADVNSAVELASNANLSCVGYQLTGQGFVVEQAEAKQLDRLFKTKSALIRPLLTGRDITQEPRSLFAIDLFGWEQIQLRREHPAIWQLVYERVKPERDQNPRNSLRERWWIFGEARSTFRPAIHGLSNVIVTSLTAKHRAFQFVGARTICDSTTVMFAFSDPFYLGILSSSVHVVWALALGGRLGVGNDPRYNKSRCFETFPFPAQRTHQAKIASIAEEIDAQRKRVLAEHADLTLTGLYNVLEKLRAGAALTDKDKAINQKGLVSTLLERHRELDALVLAEYGWSDLVPAFAKGALDEATRQILLARLVALNAERAKEEEQGTIRWLRPDYQAPDATEQAKQKQTALDIEDTREETAEAAAAIVAGTKRPWPTGLAEQMRAVADVLTASNAALTEADLAAYFTGRGAWKKRLPQIIETLVALGRARKSGARIRAV